MKGLALTLNLTKMSNIESKLTSLGITLPTPAVPVANYVGFVKSGNVVFVSGQLPIEAGKLQFIGKVGSEISADDAKKAARLCAINILAQLKVACDGDLERTVRCIKLGIFVNGDCVIRKAFAKYLHPKEAFIGNGILNKDLVRVAKGESKSGE